MSTIQYRVRAFASRLRGMVCGRYARPNRLSARFFPFSLFAPDRVPWPAGTRLASGLVAYRDHEVHVRSIGNCVLIPAFAAQALDGEAEPFDLFDRKGMHRAAWMASCAVGAKPASAGGVEDGLGNNAARGVAGAKK